MGLLHHAHYSHAYKVKHSPWLHLDILVSLLPSISIVPLLSQDTLSMFSSHLDPHISIVFQLEISYQPKLIH